MTYSITKGDVRTLNTLLEAGADINEADGNSVTPLMLAVSIAAHKKVQFLVPNRVILSTLQIKRAPILEIGRIFS